MNAFYKSCQVSSGFQSLPFFTAAVKHTSSFKNEIQNMISNLMCVKMLEAITIIPIFTALDGVCRTIIATNTQAIQSHDECWTQLSSCSKNFLLRHSIQVTRY